MAIIQKMMDAWEAKDRDKIDQSTHKEFVMRSHAQNMEFSKEEWMGFIGNTPKTEKFRLIYENDDIAVCHQFMEFESGDKEAVMMVFEIKDGQVSSMETGATPMPS